MFCINFSFIIFDNTRSQYLDQQLFSILSGRQILLKDCSLGHILKIIKIVDSIVIPKLLPPIRPEFANTIEATRFREAFTSHMISVANKILEHIGNKAIAAKKKNPNVDLKYDSLSIFFLCLFNI